MIEYRKAYQLKQGDTICFADEEPLVIDAITIDAETDAVTMWLSDGSVEGVCMNYEVEYVCGA